MIWYDMIWPSLINFSPPFPMCLCDAVLTSRDEEVVWDDVRVLNDGECVSVDGTWVLDLRRRTCTWLARKNTCDVHSIVHSCMRRALIFTPACTEVPLLLWFFPAFPIFPNISPKSPRARPARQQWESVLYQSRKCGGKTSFQLKFEDGGRYDNAADR